MINDTLNYLLAKRSVLLLNFAGEVTTSSEYLKGSGGGAGDGYIIPRPALISRLDCWDGSLSASDEDKIKISPGDRISLYAESDTGSFSVVLRINGVSTQLAVSGLSINSTLFATLTLTLINE